MFKTLLIANRGEIAIRVARTAKRLGLRTVAIYSDADRDAAHVAVADAAYRVGPAPSAESYLNIGGILAAARAAGADAIHPGYGFLSENADFADAVAAAGLVFVGPPAAAIRAMGLKDTAKTLMARAGVPVVPGYHGDRQDAAALAREAQAIGFPVLIKGRAGGGGKGMRRVDAAADFAAALACAQREAAAAFGDPRVLLERYVARPRHIEMQVFADRHGNAIHLGERDCSLQRRHQKVIEEAPAPGMTVELREALGAIAVRAAKAIGYVGAGTVEFIADTSRGLRADAIYFMEMNTRLQVEHPVTEAITGLDLVEWQLRIASGEALPLRQEAVTFSGHAFEARLYAEDPANAFLPAAGTLRRLNLPLDVARVDSGVREGDRIDLHYDPLLAKIVTHAATREAALAKLAEALQGTVVAGTASNVAFLLALAKHAQFQQGDVDTGLIERDLPMLIRSAPPLEAKAVAAIAVAGLADAPVSSDPWSSLNGWRHWTATQTTVDLECDGSAFTVQVAAQAGQSYRLGTPAGTLDIVVLKASDPGTIRFETQGRAYTATVVRHAATVTVILAGSSYVFGLPDHLTPDEEDAAASGDRVTSPMPGTIKAVLASAGASVKKGEPLIVIEAMKMEHTMTSPRDGRIAEVFVRAGVTVEAGATLFALAPLSEG